MLFAGRSIISREDKLQKIKVEYLYYGLRNPKSDIEANIRQLRIIRDLDKTQYGALKKQLPYVVCGVFNPPYRRTENFAYIEYFILDIDNLSQKEIDLVQIREKIQKDVRVMLCFISPGNDGLKLLFRLKERCYDAGIYSLFYKAFAKQFSIQYNLQQVIDSCTSDVCRACFVSVDPNAYYNEFAEPVDINAFFNLNNPDELFDLKHQLDKESQKGNKEAKVKESSQELGDEVINRVRTLLNPKAAKRNMEKPAYVPEVLEDVMEDLKKYIIQTGIIITEIRNIQYGKKVHMKAGLKEAEVNVFYGKRGFSVVQTTRCGTSNELNELMVEVIRNYLLTL